jgi:hypothetical protein
MAKLVGQAWGREDWVNCVAALVAYLAFKEPDDMAGGRTNHEARLALIALLGLPADIYDVMKHGKQRP